MSLNERGYPSNLTDDQIERAKRIPRENLLQYKTLKDNKRIPLVTTFNPRHPNMKQITNDHLPILHKSQRCEAAIPEPPIIAHLRTYVINLSIVIYVLRRHCPLVSPNADQKGVVMFANIHTILTSFRVITLTKHTK